MGGCVISNNIINGKGILKWCVKDTPIDNVDTGWRFFSDIDTEEYLNNSSNMSAYSFDKLVDIEPAILFIYDMPIGTDLILITEDNNKIFIDNKTGEKI